MEGGKPFIWQLLMKRLLAMITNIIYPNTNRMHVKVSELDCLVHAAQANK